MKKLICIALAAVMLVGSAVFVSSSEDAGVVVYPEVVRKAIERKSEPFYSTGRTFLEAYRDTLERYEGYITVNEKHLIVELTHEYSDPEGVRYTDASFFPELDIAFMSADQANRAYEVYYQDGKNNWEGWKYVRVRLEITLGDSETVESALEKLEPRHYADVFFAAPIMNCNPHAVDTFIEFPVSDKTFDENSPDMVEWRERYAEYVAPYLDKYDLNGDGTVDGDDFEISFSTQSWNMTLANGLAKVDWSEPAAIATILLRFDGDPCDLSRNGVVGESDIRLVDDMQICLKNATGDYGGPTQNDVRLAILDQGGVIGREQKDPDGLVYPETVQRALDNKTPVEGKTFSEQFREDAQEYGGWNDGVIVFELSDEVYKSYDYTPYDESFFPELDIKGIIFGDTIVLDDTETVPGAIEKLEHRRGADLKRVYADYRRSGSPQSYPGDLSGDGKTNAKDVVALMKYVIGSTYGMRKSVADVNCDGKVNAKDVTILMKKVVNGSTVTDGDSLYCRLLGHQCSAAYATETVHNAYADSPHCEKRTYLVISCGREGCGYIEKILVSSKRIANCHG